MSNKIRTFVTWFTLILVFSVSLLIRNGNYNQPIGRHHEWLMAHTIMTMTVWDEGGGPQNFHFSPAYTFKGKANNYILAFEGVIDQKGHAYYLSYPPFGLLFPYYIFKLGGLNFTVANFQLFNYCLHFLISISLFILINFIFKKKFNDLFLPSFIAFAFYMLTNGYLWFHGNTYFVDMLMQWFFIFQIYFLIKTIRDYENLNYKFYVFYGLITFFGAYTDWLACLISLISGAILLIYFIIYRKKVFIKVFLFIGICSTLSGTLTIAQYSSIAGFKEYKEAMERKYKIRSGNGDIEMKQLGPVYSDPESMNFLKRHINQNFHMLINFTGIALVIYIILLHFSTDYRFKAEELVIIAAMVIPILLHYYIFFNFNVVHDFSTLKTGLFCIVFIAIILNKLFSIINNLVKKKVINYALFATILLFFSFRIAKNCKEYYNVNPPDVKSMYSINIGTAINNYAKKDEVVFSNTPIYPETMYYCHRNCVYAIYAKHCYGWLQRRQIKTGVIFKNEGDNVQEIYRVTDTGDSTLLFKRE